MTDLAINLIPAISGFIGQILKITFNIVGCILLFTGLYYMARATYRVVFKK